MPVHEDDIAFVKELFYQKPNQEEHVTLLTYLASRDLNESCLNGATHLSGYPSCHDCIFMVTTRRGERLCGGSTPKRQNIRDIAKILLNESKAQEVKEL